MFNCYIPLIGNLIIRFLDLHNSFSRIATIYSNAIRETIFVNRGIANRRNGCIHTNPVNQISQHTHV